MSALEDYLAGLRELDELYAVRDDRRQRTADRVAELAARAEDLGRRLELQRGRLSRLCADCSLPPPEPALEPSNPAAPTALDPAGELGRAEAAVEEAAAGYQEARFLAHRPRLLPRWRGDERNGLLYGCWALAALVADVGVLIAFSGGSGFGNAATAWAVIVALTLGAWLGGFLTVRTASRPLLGEGQVDGLGRLVSHPRLGAAICASTLPVVWWVAGSYL